MRAAKDLAERYLNLPGLWQAASQAPPLPTASQPLYPVVDLQNPVKIGIVRDAAFQFYYPENLEALEQAGARLVYLNALNQAALPPDLDALYLGGGFPETNAAALAGNEDFRTSLRLAAEDGLPIYAECGGLMYLGRTIQTLEGRSYPMVGLLPHDFLMGQSPQVHALGAPDWAPALIRQAREHQNRRQTVKPREGFSQADPAAAPPGRTRRGATG
ncbi:MAG: hypothetical protein P8X58_10605 [Syntrophobacterales bacterium]